MTQTSPTAADFGKFIAQNEIRLDLLGAGVFAFVFSLVAMVAIGSYAIVMAIRVVVLWILIILSPIAFILQTLPGPAKNYAQEYWQEFTKYILVAPVLTFFLWLTFASLGAGDINAHVGIPPGYGQLDAAQALELQGPPKTSITEISTWENQSAFIIAIAFLMVGLERVGKLGVVGGSMVSGALDFGKKSLQMASGFARPLGRWREMRP